MRRSWVDFMAAQGKDEFEQLTSDQLELMNEEGPIIALSAREWNAIVAVIGAVKRWREYPFPDGNAAHANLALLVEAYDGLPEKWR